MKAENLDHLEKLHAVSMEARGPHAQGDWLAGGAYDDPHEARKTVTFVHVSNTHSVAGITIICKSQFPADAAFIAASHNAMPALIAELRALRARVADAEAEAAAEFAERKRIAETSDRSLVEANEKALEHLEARMRAEAERDALREVEESARAAFENRSQFWLGPVRMNDLGNALAKVSR